MNIVDLESIRSWFATNGLMSPDGDVVLPGAAAAICYRIPADSGRKTVLAKAIAALVTRNGPSALWISEYGIWPSSEDRGLFQGFRKSLGESGSLKGKPGHVFTSDDMAPAASLLALVLYFVWGAWVAAPQTGVLVRISHDEILEIHLRPTNDVFVTKGIEKVDQIAARMGADALR
jgi:hypothetical protein